MNDAVKTSLYTRIKTRNLVAAGCVHTIPEGLDKSANVYFSIPTSQVRARKSYQQGLRRPKFIVSQIFLSQ